MSDDVGCLSSLDSSAEEASNAEKSPKPSGMQEEEYKKGMQTETDAKPVAVKQEEELAETWNPDAIEPGQMKTEDGDKAGKESESTRRTKRGAGEITANAPNGSAMASSADEGNAGASTSFVGEHLQRKTIPYGSQRTSSDATCVASWAQRSRCERVG